MRISITPNNREEFLRMCGECYYNHTIDDIFTYDDMLGHYCDAVGNVSEVTSCHVRVVYRDEYVSVYLTFCDSSRQPVKYNDPCSEVVLRDHNGNEIHGDYNIYLDTRSLDAKFLQFMKGRSEVYFTPTTQEIVQRMKK